MNNTNNIRDINNYDHIDAICDSSLCPFKVMAHNIQWFTIKDSGVSHLVKPNMGRNMLINFCPVCGVNTEYIRIEFDDYLSSANKKEIS